MAKEKAKKNKKIIKDIEKMEDYLRGDKEISKEEEDAFFSEVEKWFTDSFAERRSSEIDLDKVKEWANDDEQTRKIKILKYMSEHIDSTYEPEKNKR